MKSWIVKLVRAILVYGCMLSMLGNASSRGATLTWNANPEPDVVFYTVHAESASGTAKREIYNGTTLLLDGWLTNGSYTLFVTATSSAGLESERSAGISYNVGTVSAPSITTQPQGAVLARGNTLSMSVVASGAGPITYQWLKDGLELTEQTSANFTKTDVVVSDSGAYSVVVANSGGSVASAGASVVVQVPPMITSQPQSTNVPNGGTLTLALSATGTARRHQWFKDGEALPGRTNATLTIGSVAAADQGAYWATVTNLVGSATTASATVAIVYPPAITSGPVSTNVATGATVQLSVTASGTAPFTYQWLKDGQPIANATGNQLQITSAILSTSGSYQVRVSNVAGSAISTAAGVSVMDRPTIVTHPASKDLLSGTALSLSVVAQGSGTLSYQWYLNDAPLAGATGAAFQVASASAANAGSYKVTVSNAVGSITSQAATVRVLPAITIVQQPASTNLPVGGQLVLGIQANGPAPLSYQWYRETAAISGATNAQFQIAQAGVGDGGSYRVEIRSAVQNVTSTIALVTVIGTAPTVVAHPQSTQAISGSEVQLTVIASGSDLAYQWMKDGATVPGAVSSTLVIANFTSADQGSYRVRVTNPFGSAESQTAVLSIIWQPTIVQAPVSTNLLAGGMVQLSVAVSGTAPFTYEWLKDRQPIGGATGASLQITNADVGASGSYQARVSNAAGSVTSSTANVRVIPEITIVQQPASTNLTAGGLLVFAVQATGPTPLNYQWYRGNAAISGATNSQFQIAQAVVTDGGTYNVEVSSLVQKVMSVAAQVTVSAEAPTITSQPSGGNYLEGTNLTLSVSATSPTPISYQWFLNGAAITGATASKYQKSSASTADSGTYTVRVANANAAVNSEPAPVQVYPPIVIVMSPTGTNVNKGGRITLYVQATGPTGITYQWFLNGTKLNGKTSSSLTVSSASLADGGVYTCQITSPVQTATTVGAEVVVIDDPVSATDCMLTLSANGTGSLLVTGVAPANTSYELQRSDSLTAPNWTRIQNVSTRADGQFQVTVPMSSVGSGFIRTVRRAN